jgi:CelD/BcsL family acetyltransferase involved in cellulose biosynthesis
LTLEPVAGFEQLRDQWEVLAEQAGNVFATWEWASAWWEELGAGRELRLFACRDPDGSIAAILPLCVTQRRAFRTMRFVGHGVADVLGPICAPADRAAVGVALGRTLGHVRGVDLLLAERLVADEGWRSHLSGRLIRSEPTSVIRIVGGSWEDLLKRRSSNFRQQVRRRERKLAREHPLRFRLADDPSTLVEDLELFFDLHDRRWAERSSSFSPARRRFHRRFAELAQQRGWLRLWFAEIDGTAVAAWYGFRFGGAEWYYQAGRDISWDETSVGFVLLCHTIREACADGMVEYRLLVGDEGYKGRFADAETVLETVAVPGSALGAAGARAAARVSRLSGKAGRSTGWLIDRTSR